jgi:hypothetical protein
MNSGVAFQNAAAMATDPNKAFIGLRVPKLKDFLLGCVFSFRPRAA